MSININVDKKEKIKFQICLGGLVKIPVFVERKRELDPILVCRLVGNYNYEGKALKKSTIIC